MIFVKTFRGRWRFTQRECSNAIAILNIIKKLTDEGTGRIRFKMIREEVKKIEPDCNVSDKLLWQLAYCGFIRISKCVFAYNGFNVMYYSYRLPKNDTFNVETLKSDVNNYIKFKEESEGD